MPKQFILHPPSQTSVKYKSYRAKAYYSWLVSRWLSLDVAAGAFICCLMACRLMGISPLPWEAAGILAGTVLNIYMMDHVLDVWPSGGNVFSPRRQFHWRYRKQLLGACLCLTGLLAATVFMFLPLPVIRFGVILAIFVIAYLWLVSTMGTSRGKIWFHKELLIACLYTAGVWGVAFIYSGRFWPMYIQMAITFGVIALQNLLLFSYYEREEDWQQQQRSIVLQLGTGKVKALLYVTFGLFLILIILLWKQTTFVIEKQVLLTQLIMSGILLMLLLFPDYFSRHKRYRWLGDGIFLLPMWLLL